MKKTLVRQVSCEVCNLEPATSFSFFRKLNANYEGYRKEVDKLGFKKSYRGSELSALLVERQARDAYLQQQVLEDKLFLKYHLDYECKLCGDCTADKEIYYITFDRFFLDSTSGPSWIKHMCDKVWFNKLNFIDALNRVSNAEHWYSL